MHDRPISSKRRERLSGEETGASQVGFLLAPVEAVAQAVDI